MMWMIAWSIIPMQARADTATASTRVDPALPAFAPQPLPNESYAETFTAIADLEDGTYVQIQLMITNIGPGSRRGGCRMLIISPRGKSVTMHNDVEPGTWSHHTTAGSELRMGACRMATQGNTTYVNGTADGTTVQLALQSAARRVTPPHFPIRAGKPKDPQIYESEILVPFATLKATIRYGDDDNVAVMAGAGYMDHSRSTTSPVTIAKGWLRFRALRAPCNVLMLIRIPRDAHAPWNGYVWYPDTQTPVSIAGPSGQFPKKAVAVGESLPLQSLPLRIALRPIHALYRYAPLEEYGLLGRMIKHIVGASITRTYRASMESNVLQSPLPTLTAAATERFAATCGQVRGILEITHVER